MKEKIKIVHNETKILRSESVSKEGLLSDERCVLQLAQSYRFLFLFFSEGKGKEKGKQEPQTHAKNYVVSSLGRWVKLFFFISKDLISRVCVCVESLECSSFTSHTRESEREREVPIFIKMQSL